jgi:hypothetical protein
MNYYKIIYLSSIMIALWQTTRGVPALDTDNHRFVQGYISLLGLRGLELGRQETLVFRALR